MHHVAVPSQRLVIPETAKMRHMPILILSHSVLSTENDLQDTHTYNEKSLNVCLSTQNLKNRSRKQVTSRYHGGTKIREYQ